MTQETLTTLTYQELIGLLKGVYGPLSVEDRRLIRRETVARARWRP